MSSLWLSIEPRAQWTRLMLCEPFCGPSLKALLPPIPAQNAALSLLLESLVAWYGLPLCAVLDADAEDVHHQIERWADYFDTVAHPQITVEWVSPSSISPARGRFFERMGDFRRAGRLIGVAATGRR
jgi:hypothetical protein